MLAIEMEMPERCIDCQLNQGDMKCVVNGNTTFDDIMRPRWCPLHEIDVEKNGTMHISRD
jgi:rubredoxin